MTSWSERALSDPGLRAWLEASIAKAGLDVHTARVEREHDKTVIAEQSKRIRELELALRQAGAEQEKRRGKK